MSFLMALFRILNSRRLMWLILPVLLTACATPQQTEVAPAQAGVDLIKSPNDNRDYRYLELDNGLRVVLISDEKADKAAASLTVFRGSFDDPVDRPGLAHFLEHMLFIGTEKYPEPDGYFQYVKKHGGGSNAYTATDHTNYFFDVQPAAFPEGLDRFAQFFISPLFSKAYVEREKNAVNSEYQLQLKEDGWRSFMVQKSAVNPAHPASRFNIGTLDTLSGDVHAALLEFFENQYSADQMGLVVLSPEPLETLAPWVTQLFGQIKNNNLGPAQRGGELFLDGQLPATLTHDTIKDSFSLSYSFPIPATAPYYRKKPVQYIANLVGHEGEGSLHALLTEKGWIKMLSAGGSDVDDATGSLIVSMELTEDGAANIPSINGYLFEYLEMLRSAPIEAWLYEEQAKVAELGFRFAEKRSAISTVQGLGPLLKDYPPEDLLVAPYLMEAFDGDLIRRYLEALTEDNLLVTIAKPGYEGARTELWFGVSYDLTRAPIEVADVSTAELRLPNPNPFLPESLTLLPDAPGKPAAIVADDAIEIYLDTDGEFGVPRAVTHVSIRNADGFSRPEDVARAHLYTRILRDDLNSLAYPALLAGVSYQVQAPPKGFRISIGGYEDKQLVLLGEVLTALTSLEIDPGRFEVLKTSLLRDLENDKLEKPYLQAYQRLQDDLLSTSYTAEALLPVVADISPEDLQSWRDGVLAGVSVESLMIGNVDENDVDALQTLLRSQLSLTTVPVAETRVADVSGASLVPLTIDHDDAAMVLYVQADDPEWEDRAKSALLTHLISAGYFATLRTEQQLGYVVTSVNTVLRDHPGISFIIQSPVAGPDVLRDRTLAFMAAQTDRLAQMSEEEFGANKGGLIGKLTQRDKNLSQRAGRYWSDLDRGVLTFDSRMQLAAAVSALSLEDMLSHLDDVNRKLGNEYLMIFSEGQFATD